MNAESYAWQPRFYDHLIRNNESLMKIRYYICGNPEKWLINQLNPEKPEPFSAMPTMPALPASPAGRLHCQSSSGGGPGRQVAGERQARGKTEAMN